MKTRIISILAFIAITINSTFAAAPLDFDGDGKSDALIVRQRFVKAESATYLDWHTRRSSDGQARYQRWGGSFPTISNDTPIPADFDGDGKTDIAVWRTGPGLASAEYHIFQSSTFTHRVVPFGVPTDNIDAIGDYDGDGKADPAIYRMGATSSDPNVFIYRPSLNNPSGAFYYVNWGIGQMNPLPGDYDGDGKTDFCIQLGNGPDAGMLILRRSSDGGVEYIRWGLDTDRTYIGDYDGDGKDDLCLRRTVGGTYHWFILERDGGGTGANPIIWGRPDLNDTVVSGLDFDGDNKADIAVYRNQIAGNNTFYIRRSSDNTMQTIAWGLFDFSDAVPTVYQR